MWYLVQALIFFSDFIEKYSEMQWFLWNGGWGCCGLPLIALDTFYCCCLSYQSSCIAPVMCQNYVTSAGCWQLGQIHWFRTEANVILQMWCGDMKPFTRLIKEIVLSSFTHPQVVPLYFFQGDDFEECCLYRERNVEECFVRQTYLTWEQNI